jgi:hypothetical protein
VNNKPLTILITNNTLDALAGSETYVIDLAKGLLAAGHRPICFSLKHGQTAEILKQHTIACIDDFKQLGIKPDVIHAQHCLETLMALSYFEDVPVINMCHGWLPWQEIPAVHPNIQSYIAVDELCKERLMLQHAISEDKITVVQNFLDIDTYQPRDPLPKTPQKALYFANSLPEYDKILIEQVCKKLKMSLTFLGKKTSGSHPNPKAILGDFDLVFAKGRSAMEALSLGCAVIVTHNSKLAGMVSSQTLSYFKPLNFGVRTMSRALNEENLSNEIKRYCAKDAAIVMKELRPWLAREPRIHKLLECYQQAIISFNQQTISSTQANQAFSDTLKSMKHLDETNRHLVIRNRNLKQQVKASNRLLKKSDANPLWQAAELLEKHDLSLACKLMALAKRAKA